MSELKLEGKLVAVFEKQQVTDTFAKREFVIETDDQYPQTIKFELTKNKCEDIDNHKIGDDVTVHFNVRGRKWTNKEGKDTYFVTLNAWRVEAVTQQQKADKSATQSSTVTVDDNGGDTLPF